MRSTPSQYHWRGTWHYIGGTGKFDGLTGGGTYQLALTWPDGKVLATWAGSAEMK